MRWGRPRLRRDGEPWWRAGAWCAAVAATAVAGLGLLLHFVATPWQATIALTAGSHYLMWAAPLALLGAAALRRWATAGVAGALTVAVAALQVPPHLADGGVPGPRRLVVLQANLKIGAADPDALVRTVRGRHVDLLATEELTIAEQQRLVAAGLPRLLPYRYTAPLPDGGGGLGIWSRYPLRDGRNLPHFVLGVLTARVDTPGADVTFVAAHVNPPYPYAPGEWRRELARLRHVRPHAGTVIVAGDFNATTDHRPFRQLLADGFADAAEQVGAGYLPTYPTDRWWGPLIGIDHVVLRRAGALDVRTLGIRGSDHRALLVRVGY